MGLSWPMGGAVWSAVAHGRYCEQKRLSSSQSPQRAFGRPRSSQKHFPTWIMPPTKATGKKRAGARQDSDPVPYPHCFCTVHINLCVRHSYFIMARSCAGKAPTSEIKKKTVKAKSPVTGQEEGPRIKTRAAVALLGHGQVARRHRSQVHRQLWHHARWCQR